MPEQKKNYKDTLLMPQTKIQMKAELLQKQSEFIKKWEKDKLYEKLLERNKNNKPWVLHDGPPYANGKIHVGHALNKILKDIIVRTKTMQGFYSPYVPGWDTHGLPIENKMLQEYNKNKENFTIKQLREESKNYALKQVESQKKQFKQLALLSDFKNHYKTLDPLFEVGQLKLFKSFIQKKLIFKDLKPVYWSPTSESALAEAEVEYANHRSPAVHIAYKILNSDVLDKETSLVIWTTTPWTIPASAAIAVGGKFEYSVIKTEKGKFVVASDLVQNFKNEIKFEQFSIIKTLLGKEIVKNTTIISPINKLECKVVIGNHVTTDNGTGLVHIAPYFGEDDFIIGKENNLDLIMHVDDKGFLTKESGSYEGLFWLDSNKNIGMDLDKMGSLLSLKFIKHSYPHDWRTHKPIMYRATPQWFVSIDKMKNEILSSLDSVTGYPNWGIDRMKNMISNRKEWCISRQRTWGVPIPIFYDENKKPVMDTNLIDHVIELVRKNGTDIWFNLSTDELLPEKYKNKGWTKEKDIMDVWFDSGSSFIGVKESNPILSGLDFDMYLEGTDQFRGWFNSSLISSIAFQEKSPYKELLTHGFVLDGKGNKMSKSKGNVIDPLKVINKNGVDILRLWVANSEYSGDIKISDDILKQTTGIYRKIRNTIKFMDGNLFDFEISDSVELKGVHKLVNEQFKKFISKSIDSINSYSFVKFIKELNNFLVYISSFYLDVHRDDLYVESPNNFERRSVQTNIYNFMKKIIVLISPILPVTSEDLYKLSNIKNKKESVFFVEFPKKEKFNQDFISSYDDFFSTRDHVYKLIEEKIRSKELSKKNWAIVTTKLPDSFSSKWTKLMQVYSLKNGEDKIQKLQGIKCNRCWGAYKESEIIEDICNRCNYVIKNN
ncbi:MAG: isoleucine--tRNA ligase [Mollicutes bacterium PWAP]|nr:isoleucine--tRNA ligase [Mollicutes bacterium PWAP]